MLYTLIYLRRIYNAFKEKRIYLFIRFKVLWHTLVSSIIIEVL
jgi:hypothetical protein